MRGASAASSGSLAQRCASSPSTRAAARDRARRARRRCGRGAALGVALAVDSGRSELPACRPPTVGGLASVAPPADVILARAMASVLQPRLAETRASAREAGSVVLEADGAAVQARDGGDEAEPQAAAGPRAALLQPHEALQRALAVLRRECRGRCRRRRSRCVVAAARQRDGDRAALRRRPAAGLSPNI